MSTTHVVAAIFPDRDSAVATRETLGHEHYHFRWLAVTKPADEERHAHDHDHDPEAVLPEVHAIAEGSDGAVGAFGRFLSGAGSSLRKALEDHGVPEMDAEAIDAATAPHGAVLVVHAAVERVADATALLEQGGGRVFRGGELSTTGGATTNDAALAAGAAGAGAYATRPPSADPGGVSNTIGATPDASGTTRATDPIGTGGATDPLGTVHGENTYGATGANAADAADGGIVATDPTPEQLARASLSDDLVIRKRTVTDTAFVEVPIDREEVFIERRPSTPPQP